ncbi:unnamed protein product [Cylicocyclus nassatus]|uniref:Uncharacterized protein n=1 Tax=Cylicocyclus nassatus TaxID=53992 RepID=A0AA36ME66_CYLNA|nr:unnamed protein product [Cylicocyclus nassatus]
MEKVSKAGEAIKEKVKAKYEEVAPAGQGNRFMEETGYENVRQTEKDIRRETERRMEHAKKIVEEKVGLGALHKQTVAKDSV